MVTFYNAYQKLPFFFSYVLYLCSCIQTDSEYRTILTNARANMGVPCTTTRKALTAKKNKMEADLKKLADQVTANIINCTKEVLTSAEAAKYMGISMSYLYKLTMRQQIPHYKPMGKMCYFNRAELEQWLQGNKVATSSEINQQAQAYCMKKGGAI